MDDAQQESPKQNPTADQELINSVRAKVTITDPCIAAGRAFDRAITISRCHAAQDALLFMFDEINRLEKQLLETPTIQPNSDFAFGYIRAAADQRRIVVNMLRSMQQHRHDDVPPVRVIHLKGNSPEELQAHLEETLAQLTRGGQ